MLSQEKHHSAVLQYCQVFCECSFMENTAPSTYDFVAFKSCAVFSVILTVLSGS